MYPVSFDLACCSVAELARVILAELASFYSLPRPAPGRTGADSSCRYGHRLCLQRYGALPILGSTVHRAQLGTVVLRQHLTSI